METRYTFRLVGATPLLMHADDVMAADTLKEWRIAPENKNLSVPGDDRSPAWTWHTYCYSDGEFIVIPAENMMVCLRSAGSQMVLKGSKKFTEITQSGMCIPDEFLTLTIDGKQIPISLLSDIKDLSFAKQMERVKQHGFVLYAKRASINKAKHVRVRPRFNKWEVSGRIHVIAKEITEEKVRELFRLTERIGLCDWRPGCRKPGPFGMFDATVKKA